MIQILKYIFFLVFGIILFILYNSVNKFSVGIEPFIYTTPGSPNIHYATNLPPDYDYFLNLSGTGATLLEENGEVLIIYQIYNNITEHLPENNPFVHFRGHRDPDGIIHIPITQEQGGGGGIPGIGGGEPTVPPSRTSTISDLFYNLLGIGMADPLCGAGGGAGGGGAGGGGAGGGGAGGGGGGGVSSCAATSQSQDIYIITGNQIELASAAADGYYTVSKSIELTIDEYILIYNLLSECSDIEGERILSILRSGNKSAFLRDLKRDNILFYQDTEDDTSIRYQGLINYYTSNTFSIDNLRDYGLGYELLYQDGNFSIYRLTIVDHRRYSLNMQNIKNLYVRSGNSRQNYGFPNANGTTYMLTEGSENYIRGRLNYGNHDLESFTVFPVGHGYGLIFLRMLYALNLRNNSEDVIINSLWPEQENISAYRRLFRLSVTPNILNPDGFVEGPEFNFTIFRPNINLMRTLYPHYDELYTYIDPGNREHFNLFLMSLSEDILTANLIGNYNPEVLKQMYNLF
jgi:hypothetical protein